MNDLTRDDDFGRDVFPDPLVGFARAREHPGVVVLDGLHPLKHARRFGASLMRVVVHDLDRTLGLAEHLAPDVLDVIKSAEVVSPATFSRLAPRPNATGVMTLARRPAIDMGNVLLAATGPVVLLEDPRDHGNIGACIRVAAAAEAAALLTTGDHDPWAPAALAGSAGLHFALPVARIPTPLDLAGRKVIALDPDGRDLEAADLSDRSVLVFGNERRGLSDAMLERADTRLRLPMRSGVSSINLAASVSAVLYAWRLNQ
jgi:RNA methyltransferase, TrmH family